MKKLMIALSAAAAALFTFGDGPYSAADFELGYDNGVFRSQLADDGETESGARYWYSTSNDGNVISNHADSISTTLVPDYFQGDYGNKYLWLDTSAPLFRTIRPNDQVADNVSTNGEAIGANGIYLDTLVKFTAADKAFESNLDEGDKIAIEYVECDADTDPNGDGYTNFVIRAGQYVNETLGQANYSVPVPEGFSKDDWHRLTVRTIANVGVDDQNPVVGFVVYLDQNPLAYTNGDNAAGFGTLNAVAQVFGNRNALYPSAIAAAATGGSTITAASFSGTGAIDDVVFTSVKPEFIATNELVMVTFTVDAGVDGLSVVVGDQTNIVDITANPIVCALPSGTTSFELAVTLDPNGYTLVGVTGDDVTSWENNVVTFTGVAPTIAVTTTRNNVSYINDSDETVACATLAEAFANAKDGSTITLAYDLDANGVEAAGFVGYEISDIDVTLDLNGKTITAVDSEGEALFTVNSGASLTVIDSSSANTGTIEYDTEYGVFYAEGEVIVGAETGDYGPFIIGPLLSFEDDPDVTVVRAKLDGAGNSTAGGEFAMENYLDSGIDVSDALVNGFWVVMPSGQFALTTSGGDNATVVTDPAAVAALTEETEVTITATANTNYTYDGVDLTDTDWVYDATTDSISLTITVSSNTNVVVPDAVPVILGTYQVTVTPTANATYEAVYTQGGTEIVPDNDVLTVTVGQTITITATPAENYEYAETPTGWTAGQAGEITIEVSAAGTVVIPAPTEKQVVPETWTVTITLSNHVTSVSYVFVDTPETTNTLSATGSFTIEKGKSFVLVGAVAESGWEIDLEASLATLSGATFDPTYYFVTPSADASATVIAKEVVVPPSDYKVEIEGLDVAITLSPEEIAAFATAGYDTVEEVNAVLAQDFGKTGAKVWEVMFLGLDATDPDALDAFKLASITKVDGKWTLTMPDGITLQTGRGVDITLNVYGSDDLVTWGSTPLATATNTTEIPGITPALGESKKFYKVEVEFSATPQP